MEEEIPSLIEILKKEYEFNPGPLLYLVSKKVDEKIKVEHDASYHIYFISENNHKLDFRIHELEFSSPSEWLYWQRASLKNKEARMDGIYTMLGTFYGSIKTSEKTLEVIARNKRVVKLRSDDERTKNLLPLVYGIGLVAKRNLPAKTPAQ